MQTFNWNTKYEVGVLGVDNEHQELVRIINELGNQIDQRTDRPKELSDTLNKLLSYTQYHFHNEEVLMKKMSIDERHLEKHIKAHGEFISKVNELVEKLPSKSNCSFSYHQLLDFLTHWLVFHILGIDKSMANQIQAIENGMSAASAYEQFKYEKDITTEPLFVALNLLFERVNERNKELIELNATLESRVEERTRELNESNKKLTKLSVTDSLTNLPNRRFAMLQLEQFWKEAQEHNHDLANIMIDADHFKEVNDNFGHDAGDIVLQTLSKELSHAFRNDDLVCRLGGDEFYVICPRTDLEGALRVAEFVQERISKLVVKAGNGSWYGSISVGVAAKDSTMTSHNELLKQADLSVYKAKEHGKNCVQSIQSTQLASIYGSNGIYTEGHQCK